MIIGFTSGCFDLIHVGHIHYLQRCRTLCDRLVVGVDSDTMVRAAKGLDRPVVPEWERLALVNSLGCVDAALIFHHLADLSWIARNFAVNKVFKHEGFKNPRPPRLYGIDGTGAELVIVPDVPGLVSTTEIIGRIRERMP